MIYYRNSRVFWNRCYRTVFVTICYLPLIHTQPRYVLQIHFNIILYSKPVSSKGLLTFM